MPIAIVSAIPSYRRQKTHSGDRAFVEMSGRRIYLGQYGSKESRQSYDRAVAEWLAAGRALPVPVADLTIAELLIRYHEHAEKHYRKPDGTPTSTISGVRLALKPVKHLYGPTAAAEFGPLALRAIQGEFVRQGLARPTVNQFVGIVKAVFKWATSRQMVSESVYNALLTVEGLARGRSDAREGRTILPVPAAHIDAIRTKVSRQVWALIQLQLLTGSRAGEVVGLRPIDLDTTGSVWTAKVSDHKTAHHGHARTLYIGPKAQEAIKPFITGRAIDAPLFSPAEAEQDRHEARHAARKTPMSCGNTPGSNRARRPAKVPGTQYDVCSYRRAIAVGCKKAGVPSWHPHQLRHNAATNLRKEFGIETARLILGHKNAAMTEIYAEADQGKALDVIGKVG